MGSFALPLDPGGKGLRENGVAGRPKHRVLDTVLQLPHVARPVVLDQKVHGLEGDLQGLPLGFGSKPLEDSVD